MMRADWLSDKGVVRAWFDPQGQVVAFGVATASSDFAPIIPFRSKMRLGHVSFSEFTADLGDVEPSSTAGVRDAAGRWSYQEFLGGGWAATGYRQIALGTGWILLPNSNEEIDAAGNELATLQLMECLSLSLEINGREAGTEQCPLETVRAMRDGMRIDEFTVGSEQAIERIDAAGEKLLLMPFDPEAGYD